MSGGVWGKTWPQATTQRDAHSTNSNQGPSTPGTSSHVLSTCSEVGTILSCFSREGNCSSARSWDCSEMWTQTHLTVSPGPLLWHCALFALNDSDCRVDTTIAVLIATQLMMTLALWGRYQCGLITDRLGPGHVMAECRSQQANPQLPASSMTAIICSTILSTKENALGLWLLGPLPWPPQGKGPGLTIYIFIVPTTVPGTQGCSKCSQENEWRGQTSVSLLDHFIS